LQSLSGAPPRRDWRGCLRQPALRFYSFARVAITLRYQFYQPFNDLGEFFGGDGSEAFAEAFGGEGSHLGGFHPGICGLQGAAAVWEAALADCVALLQGLFFASRQAFKALVGEVGVEGEGAGEAAATHEFETGAIHQAEVAAAGHKETHLRGFVD